MANRTKKTKAVEQKIVLTVDKEELAVIEASPDTTDSDTKDTLTEVPDAEEPDAEEEEFDERVHDDSFLPKKNSFRIDETARYFEVDNSTVRNWIDHGHLQAEKVVGTIMITRKSILKCRFANTVIGRMEQRMIR